MRKLGLFLVCVIATMHVMAQKTKESFTPSSEYLIEGVNYHNEGKYREAIDSYKKISLSDTNGLLAAYELALSYVAFEKPDSAIYYAKYILDFKSEYRKDAYDILGSAYDVAKMPEKALETYDLGLKEFPSYHKFHFEKGVTYTNMKLYPEAVASYQKAIELNPYHATSHLRLGYLALNNDMLVPGVMSMLQFLLIEPGTNRSLQVLIELEKHLKRDTVIPRDSIKYSTAGENTFAELDEIIRSKVALNDAYKTKIKLNYYGIIKQLQLMFEKMELNPADKGYWNTYYTPIYKGIWDRNLFEPFIYYIFQSATNDKVEMKMVKKKKKEIAAFTDYVRELLNEKRKFREVTINGVKAKKHHWYMDGGLLEAIGEYDEAKQIRTGDWIVYNSYGYIVAEGKYTKDGKKMGSWKYYYDNGIISSEINYKDDELEGKYTLYHENGAIKEMGVYKKGKVDGEVKSFNVAGAPSSTSIFKNGVVEGEYLDYDDFGLLSGKFITKSDKPNGKFSMCYENGAKKIEGTYVNGEIEGKMTSYHRNGNVDSEGSLTAGKKTGEWKYYFKDKKIKEVGSFANDLRTGVWKEYHDNGKLFAETNYKDGVMEGKASYYTQEGKLFSEIEYKADAIFKYKFLDKNGKELSKGENKGGKLTYKKYNQSGYLVSEGNFEKGKEEGVWKYYYATGQLSSTITYKNGLAEGKSVYYYPNGTSKRKEYNCTAGNADGYYKEYFMNGALRSEGWYQDDMLHGEWKYYYPNGKLDEVKYFTNDALTGTVEYYRPNGKKYAQDMYDKTNTLDRYKVFDTIGNVYQTIDLKNGNGKFEANHINGKPQHYGVFKYERFDGLETSYYGDGSKMYEIQNQYGKEHGTKIQYWPNGQIKNIDTLAFNVLQGVHKTFYENGKLSRQYTNVDGSTEGEYIAYHQNGAVSMKGNFKDDDRHGYFYSYSQDGMLRYRLNYYYGLIISYSYEDKSGNFVPEIMLPKGTGTVKSFYKNGQPSAEFGVEAGYYNGIFKFFFSNGTIESEEKMLFGDNMGYSKEYLPSGKLLLDENYVLDEKDGVCTTYYETGTIKSKEKYHLGFKHGICTYYDAKGNVSKTINFYYDVPLK
jgi:antitoxin component YwqK of YwqJK toxin-antitoxin module